MDVVYFLIWFAVSFLWVLLFPIENRIDKMSEDSGLKKWWRKNVIAPDPNQKETEGDINK